MSGRYPLIMDGLSSLSSDLRKAVKVKTKAKKRVASSVSRGRSPLRSYICRSVDVSARKCSQRTLCTPSCSQNASSLHRGIQTTAIAMPIGPLRRTEEQHAKSMRMRNLDEAGRERGRQTAPSEVSSA